MGRQIGYLIVVLSALMTVGTRIPTQPASAANVTPAQAEANTDIDPDAMTALTKMGTYLRSLNAFQIESTSTRDDVLENGQLVTLDNKVNFLVRFPDRLRVEVTSPQQHRLYLYNGKDFTVFAERVNYYATVPAPATVGKLAIELDERYGIEIPLEDLFFWGTPQSKEKDITGAADIGPSEIGGVTCEHYAFRQKGLDWQVWIQLGDYPLPRKLVLTTLTDDARPQYTTTMTWNLAPSYNEAAFEFNPPPDVHKIDIAQENASKDTEN
jgi:hypothetical protein